MAVCLNCNIRPELESDSREKDCEVCLADWDVLSPLTEVVRHSKGGGRH